jgi:Zn-dependent protease with chaperone function
MTVALLGAGWIVLAGLVSPSGSRLLWRLAPRVQVVVVVAALGALALIPVSALTVTLSTALAELGGTGSLLDRCDTLLVALLDEPLAHLDVTLSLVLLGIGSAGVVIGVTRAWRSQASSWRMARTGSGDLVIADSARRFAFTAGLLRPRVVVSRALLEHTPAQWHSVVLAHEHAHRRGRHPLLMFVAEALARGLPLLPLRWAADQLRLSLEAVADEHATRAVGDRALVAEAIGSLALAPAGGTVGFEGDEVRRVRRLLATPPPVRPMVGTAIVLATLTLIGFAGAHAAHCGDASVRALQTTQCRAPH